MKLIDQFNSSDLHILKILIDRLPQDTYVTSAYLSELTGRVTRTIKEDMKRISALLESKDVAKIVSERGKGYKLIPLQHEKYIRFSYCIYTYTDYYGKKNRDVFKRQMVILKLLLIHGEVSIDDLINELYTNRTTLLNDLNEVKHILDSYHMEIKGNHIIRLNSSSEFSVRLLICNYAIQEYSGILDEIDDMIVYTEQLVGKRLEYYQLRKLILDYLRDIDYVLNEVDVNILPLYICAAKKRMQEGHLMGMESESWIGLKNKAEYRIAKEIMNIANLSAYHEEELLALSALLFCGRDFDLCAMKDLPFIDASLQKECELLYDDLYDDFSKGEWAEIVSSAVFKKNKFSFVSLLMKLLSSIRYGYTGISKLMHNLECAHYHFSHMAKEMARCILLKMQKRYSCDICGYNYLELVNFLDSMLNQIPFSLKKQSLIVSSYLGRTIANQEADYLKRAFSDYIDSIDVMNFYEIRKLNFEQYDWILTDREFVINRYAIPVYYYHFLDEQKESKLFSQLFMQDQISKTIEELCEITHAITNVKCRDKEGFYQMIALIYATEGNEEKLYRQIKEKDAILSYQQQEKVFAVILDKELCKKEMIDIYEVRGFAKYVIVINAQLFYQINGLKICNLILDELLGNQEYMQGLLKHCESTYQQIGQSIKKRLYRYR